jgi:serine/threonine-protein kinase SRPK3
MENEPLVICPIEKCLQAYDILTEKEILSTAAFMRKCLTVDAQKRPTASQLLREPWIS